MRNNSIIIGLILTVFAIAGKAQVNVITTGVPFLQSPPDARAASLGNSGAATTPDVNSQYWNAAKYVFMEPQAGVSLNYSSLKNQIIKGAYGTYLSGYYKLDELQSVSASMNVFVYGNEISFKDEQNQFLGTHKPIDMSFDLAYSRKLSEYFSGAITARYIRSDISYDANNRGDKAGQAVAADVAVFFSKPVTISDRDFGLAAGMSLSNIGTKISYNNSGDSYFIPMNMRLGAMMDYRFEEVHKLALSVDVNKLLVPTPPEYDGSGNIVNGKDPDRSVLSSIFTSFGDAPGGFSEEMKEFTASVGAEYSYMDLLFLRTGYYGQSTDKGAGSFFSFGAGVAYEMFSLDAAYLVPQYSLYENTFKLTFSVKF